MEDSGTGWIEALSDFLDAHRQSHKVKTLQWYRGMIWPLIVWAEKNGVSLAQFQRKHMDRYTGERSAEVGKRTIEAVGRCMRVFLRYCVAAEYVERNVLQDYVVVKSPRAVIRKPTSDELRRLLVAIKDRMDIRKNRRVVVMDARQRRFLASRDYALISGLIETGCRVSEMCNLLMADFDADGKQVRFRDVKEEGDKIVPISDAWILSVRDWLKVRPPIKTCSTLFMSRCGRAMNKDSVKHTMNAAIAFAGLPHATRHSLRHYTLTEIAKRNVLTAARMAGHKDLKTTMRYLHEDMDAVRADMEIVAPLRNLLNPAPSLSTHNPRRQIIKRG